MLCRSPYMMGTLECPCGGCLTCRINRRRVWAHRILLESFKHGDSCFATLTYDNEHCPELLVKSDYQLFVKRLRKSVFPRPVRYFLAGEYGELSGRPHFHLAIFGLDSFTAGGVDGQAGFVKASWPHGFTRVGELTWESAQYIAGYLTKKVNGDIERGVKEFSRMSLRPGIGAWAMGDVARVLASEVGLDEVARVHDVPSVLKHGKRLLPLGRYLRRRLRGELGFVSKDTPAEASRMFVLQQAAQKSSDYAALIKSGFKAWDAHKMMIDMRTQKILNCESRFKVRDSKRSLT